MAEKDSTPLESSKRAPGELLQGSPEPGASPNAMDVREPMNPSTPSTSTSSPNSNDSKDINDPNESTDAPKLRHHHAKALPPTKRVKHNPDPHGAGGSTGSNSSNSSNSSNRSNGSNSSSAISFNDTEDSEKDEHGYEGGKSASNGSSSNTASSDSISGSGQGTGSSGSSSSEDGEDNGDNGQSDDLAGRKAPYLIDGCDREPPFSSSEYSSSDDVTEPTEVATNQSSLSYRQRTHGKRAISVVTASTTDAMSETVSEQSGLSRLMCPAAKKLRPSPFFYYSDHSHLGHMTRNLSLIRQNFPASFPVKLHAILIREDLSDIFAWMDHGRAFTILNLREFELRVLPVYFKSSRFSAFLQEAWEWGFRKLQKTTSDKWAFYNEYFLRGIPQLCTMMSESMSDRLNDPLSDYNHEPNLLQISAEHPLPERIPPDDIYAQELRLVNRLIHESGPNAKMDCSLLTLTENNEQENQSENDVKPFAATSNPDAVSSSQDVTQAQGSLQRGTYQQMHEYFQERLKIAMANLPASLTNTTLQPNDPRPGSNAFNLIFGILSQEANFALMNNSTNSDQSSSSSTSQTNNPPMNSNALFAGLASNPMYAGAVEAWRSLANVHPVNPVIPSSVDVSQPGVKSEEDGGNSGNSASSQGQEILVWSQESIDSLCCLLVQAVTAGAILGFQVTRARQNNDVETGTESPENSDSSS